MWPPVRAMGLCWSCGQGYGNEGRGAVGKLVGSEEALAICARMSPKGVGKGMASHRTVDLGQSCGMCLMSNPNS